MGRTETPAINPKYFIFYLIEKFQLLFSSAENALDKGFLEIIKRNSKFQSSLAAIVVDELHTVQTWTGKRYIIKLL